MPECDRLRSHQAISQAFQIDRGGRHHYLQGYSGKAEATAPPPGHVWTTYYHAGAQRIAQRVITSTAPGTLYYLHGDHLGSTSLVTCGTAGACGALGDVVARQLYKPFGEVRYAAGTLPTDFGFQGQRLDDIGLVHMGARMYDPYLYRFVSADTLVPAAANPQTLNRYTMVLNNPLRFKDPSGHDSCQAQSKEADCEPFPADNVSTVDDGALWVFYRLYAVLVLNPGMTQSEAFEYLKANFAELSARLYPFAGKEKAA